MCGIAGFTYNNKKIILKMLKTIKHRGYDEETTYIDSNISIGMNRLSIVDLTKNMYPFKYKQYLLFYNGEIYNYQELKKLLQKKKVKFKTNSDAEVILPLFHFYGPRSFKILEGMFAISIYDAKDKIVYLARDKAGEKPLYFYIDKSNLFFASETKVLLQYLPKQKFVLNKLSLCSYLNRGSVPGSNTLISGIRKIPPASFLRYDIKNKTSELKEYWQPKTILKKSSLNLAIKKLDKLINQSVKSRLLSDVPLGCFLSGGVDSSLITYFASQHINNLRTYSISFPESKSHDETQYALFASKRLVTVHKQIACTALNLRPVLENIVSLVDEPIIDPAVLPTYLLAKEARKSVKVVLTGEGADELFAGYYRFHKEWLAGFLYSGLLRLPVFQNFRKVFFKNRFKKLFTPLNKHYSSQNIWTARELSKLLSFKTKELYPVTAFLNKLSSSNPLLAMQLTDFKGYLAEQLLMKVDKITMANNLEARAPYLDTKIMDFAFSLNPEYKRRGIHGKYILKKVAEKYFPKSFTWRFKHSFGVPLNLWFRNEWKDIVYDSLKDSQKYPQFFNHKFYKETIEEHMAGKNQQEKIWGMIILISWIKHYNLQ